MVKSNKQQRPLPATDRSSVSVNGSVNYMEHTYCVVLHVVEAINFYGREIREGEREQIIMNAALNTIDFEVEGTPSVTAETIIFNSNCIWECDMAGIKRIKTDHRPVKVTFFTCSNGERKIIGSLLLPVRGLPVLGTGGNNSALQLKMFWHKLICISNEFRSHKPEVLLMLAIIKKSLLHTKDFKHLMAFNSSEKQSRTPPLQSPGHSITANMLQSQANVYVQSLVQLGLLQVGNDPLVDCDIIEVVLQFKQLKNLNKFVKSLYTGKDVVETVLLMFDFVGNVTNIDLKLNNTDSYTLNDVLGLRFKSSLRSIRLYFQRIFYLPINMYINGTSIANYRMDFGKLLPPDNYFADRRKYVHSGSFAFERFGRMGSARELKPIMEYTFTVDIQEVYWRQQEKEPAPQLQQQLLHEEQPDLQSVGSKAVIREVPKDRPNDHVVDWKCKSDKPSASANGSVASLNVGAELSASDERDTASESPLSDAPDSDAPVTAHTSQARRRKFTRLIVNNPDLDMEDEHQKNQTYASKVVSGKLSLGHELREEEDEDFMEMADDVGSECLPTRAQEPKELRKHIPTNRNTEKQTANAARCDKKNPNESEASRSFKEKQLKSHLDDRTSKYLRDEMQLKDHMTKSVDEYELDERNTEGSWAEQEQESETMTQHVSKGGRTHRVKSKPVKELTQAEPKVAAKPFSAETDKIDINCDDSLKSAMKINLPTEDALGIKTKIIRKKKSVTTEEIELLEAASPLKSVTTLKSAKEKKYMASQESLNEVEPEMDYASEEHKRQSRADLGKKHISKRPVDHALDMDTATETEELEELRQRSSTRKIKSKPIMPEQTEVSETLLTKKTSETKNTVVSKTDLSLSARWVEVSKAQTKALEETEEYIGATCNAQQENTSCEEQPSESPKFSMARKQERLSRTIQKKNIEYTEVSISSEMEPSSLVEESSKESKLVRRLLKKKKVAENLEEAQKNFEMEPSSEETFREPKVKQRVLKKKPSTAACQDEQTEPQANQLRTKSSKAKEVIFLETEHVTSEMESLESMESIRKHEKKMRRVLKNASPQNCLDAEEAVKVPQDMGDKAEPRLKRRTVRTTPLEPQEADSIELDAMERRKAAKKPNKPDQSEQGEAGSKKMSATKSQMDLDALVSRLEVTVHMYDQTRGASTNTTCVDQSVNTDITNMNESIKRIVAAGKQLQDEMLRTSQENLDNASQQSALDNQAREQHILSPKYETKFNELEQHVALLEQHLRKFESRTQEMQQANSKLAQEKLQLKERLVNMELQIAQLRQQNSGGNDIQQMLSEMRVQNVRYLDMTKAKDRYKKQWRRSAKRVHALKLAMYERTVQQEYLNVPSNVLNLKSILTQDAAEFEREYGRFRRSGTALSFSGSASESQEPLLKDYLRGLSTQTVQQQRPGHHVDGTRMH